MRTLRVTDFSAIRQADIRLSRVTVLIGPQASGKSLLSKLSCFFEFLPYELRAQAMGSKSLAAANEALCDKFRKWFPPQAWGSRKFTITYEVGGLRYRITRSSYRGKVVDDEISLRLSLPQQIRSLYAESLELLRLEAQDPKSDLAARGFSWNVHENWDKRLSTILTTEYVDSVTFIPAGRSFFTSIGKTIVAFEHSLYLDELTINFGRVLNALQGRIFGSPQHARHAQSGVLANLYRMLGGTIHVERDIPYVQTEDGRRVPFPTLSSGQQELIPLLIVLEGMQSSGSADSNRLLYIEEPEAHLFPSAQSTLIETLATFVNSKRPRVQAFLTSHSPYVLAKLNNLLKANEVAHEGLGALNSQVKSIVPESAWLKREDMSAYTIANGCSTSIMDRDGLIAADYLDDVSGDIAREFSALLALQYPQ